MSVPTSPIGTPVMSGITLPPSSVQGFSPNQWSQAIFDNNNYMYAPIGYNGILQLQTNKTSSQQTYSATTAIVNPAVSSQNYYSVLAFNSNGSYLNNQSIVLTSSTSGLNVLPSGIQAPYYMMYLMYVTFNTYDNSGNMYYFVGNSGTVYTPVNYPGNIYKSIMPTNIPTENTIASFSTYSYTVPSVDPDVIDWPNGGLVWNVLGTSGTGYLYFVGMPGNNVSQLTLGSSSANVVTTTFLPVSSTLTLLNLSSWSLITVNNIAFDNNFLTLYALINNEYIVSYPITVASGGINGITLGNPTLLLSGNGINSIYTFGLQTSAASGGSNYLFYGWLNASNSLTVYKYLTSIGPLANPPMNPPMNPVPAFPGTICFVEDTMVTTDQGDIRIDALQPHFHSINKQTILAVTRTRYLDDSLVFFKKHSFSRNVPDRDTTMSLDHKVYYSGRSLTARTFAEHSVGKFVKYDGATLFNVVLEGDTHCMVVHNMLVESLHPDNLAARLILTKWINPCRESILSEINECVENADRERFNALCKQLHSMILEEEGRLAPGNKPWNKSGTTRILSLCENYTYAPS